jgi:hypothetical protein
VSFAFFRSSEDNRALLIIPALGLELTVKLPKAQSHSKHASCHQKSFS